MTKRTFFFLALVCASAISAHAQKIALTKGQKLESVTTTKANMEMMGQNIDNESSSTNAYEVKEINAEGYVFNSNIKRLTTKLNGMGQDMSFDSDKKEDMDGQVGQALKGKIGVDQEIRVDKNGKVTSTGDQAAGSGGMSDMMGGMTGDITKGQPFALLMQLPAKSIKPGDSWTDSSGTPASLKTVTIYTLKAITADGIQVSYTGTMAKSGTIQQNGMEMQLDLSGNTKGEAVYETNTGILKTSAGSIDLKGTMGIMGQNVPLSAIITANVVAKKV